MAKKYYHLRAHQSESICHRDCLPPKLTEILYPVHMVDTVQWLSLFMCNNLFFVHFLYLNKTVSFLF